MRNIAEWWRRRSLRNNLRDNAMILHEAEALLATFPTQDDDVAFALAGEAVDVARFNGELRYAATVCHRAAAIAEALAEVQPHVDERSSRRNPTR